MSLSLKRQLGVALIALAALLSYWPGLSGPLLFDDEANLAPVGQWLEGEIGVGKVIFGNESGLLGRPVSMASFVATAAAFGSSVFAFKATNLAIHLAGGLLVFILIRVLATRDRKLPVSAQWLAIGVAAVWLLHPMLVGTVLYVVQRMAMLSALFMLCALLAYFHGRSKLELGPSRSGVAWLFVGVPVFTILAALSKENGLLAPLLCGVLEWAYFRPAGTARRPNPVRLFLGLFVFAPIAFALLLLVVKPGFYFDGYANRPFSPVERVLTQGRVLFDYVAGLLRPAGPKFSLYRDDYPLSTGLFTPWTTAAAWVGWAAVVALAVRIRTRMPGFSAGIGIFLVGHAMESSVFPLLIYFEHRNYLPAIGLLLAVATLIAHGYARIRDSMARPRLLAGAGFAALLVVLAGAVFARALIWQDKETMVQQSLKAYPDSRFARMEMANLAMNRRAPAPDLARRQYLHLIEQPRPSTQMIGRLGLITIDCFVHKKTAPEQISGALDIQPEAVEADLITAIKSLASIVGSNECQGLSPERLASELVGFSDRLSASGLHSPTWRLRFRAARLFAAADEPDAALAQATQAWNLRPSEIPIGMFAAQLHAGLGNIEDARRLLTEIAPRIPESDRTGQRLLGELRATLDAAAGLND